MDKNWDSKGKAGEPGIYSQNGFIPENKQETGKGCFFVIMETVYAMFWFTVLFGILIASGMAIYFILIGMGIGG